MISATTTMPILNFTGKKIEADDLPSMEVAYLNKIGMFKENGRTVSIVWEQSMWNEKRITMRAQIQTIRRKDEWELLIKEPEDEPRFDQSIRLTTTPCRYGGKRFWFLCGGGACKHPRVGVLYLLDDEFLCRDCLNLTYHSKNKPDMSEFWPLTASLKMERLRNQIKRPYYRGEPTKKQLEFEMLEARLFIHALRLKSGAKNAKQRSMASY